MGLADLPARSPCEPEPWTDRLPVSDWVTRAQDGLVHEVLAEVEGVLARPGLGSTSRARVLYAYAIALHIARRNHEAVAVAEELCDLCDELRSHAAGLRARALLIDFLRREGQIEQAVQHLADAAVVEPALHDLQDTDVQAALGAFAVALRLSGVSEEARRIEQRLAMVEPSMPRHQRVSRWSNLAFESAVRAMTTARRAPFVADEQAMRLAVESIQRAAGLLAGGVYDVVADEAQVITALQQAMFGAPQQALAMLDRCAGVIDRGPEAINAQLLWGAARVRALSRLGRGEEAVRV